MGIRFYCPTGHRLNVKDFLAGKRGICPHCQSRFRIPRESEIPKGSPKLKPGSAAEMTAAPSPRRRNGSSSGAGSSGGASSAILGAAATIQKSVVAAASHDEPVFSTDSDPIDESPDSVWYVRPPAGGQYGPAKGDVVRRWVAEGRVSADSLVWREGWPDWRLAGPIFPGLSGLNGSQGKFSPLETSSESADTDTKVAAQPSLPTPRKEPKRAKSAAMVIGLVLLVVVLATGLVTVLALKS